MKPYATDLRERIAAACAAGTSSPGQVAARFSVSLSFVNKLLKRQRRTSGAARTRWAACVAQQPDTTLEELRVHLAASGGPAVGRTTAGQVSQGLDLRRTKRVPTPPSATPSE